MSRGVRATVPRLRTSRRSAGRGPIRRRGLTTRPSPRRQLRRTPSAASPRGAGAPPGLPGATRATSAPWIPARREPSPRDTIDVSRLRTRPRVLAWRQARQLLDHRGFLPVFRRRQHNRAPSIERPRRESPPQWSPRCPQLQGFGDQLAVARGGFAQMSLQREREVASTRHGGYWWAVEDLNL